MFGRGIYGIELVQFLLEHGYYTPPTPGFGLVYLFPRGDYSLTKDCIAVAVNGVIGLNCLEYCLIKAGYTLNDFKVWLEK